MSSKLDTRAEELIGLVARGDRVKSVRETMGLKGEDFAKRVASTAAAFGMPMQFDKSKLSRIEGGTRTLTVEEAAAIAFLDPEGRSVQWLAFGRAEPIRAVQPIEPGIVEPAPRSGKPNRAREAK